MADVGKILDKLAERWGNLETVEKNALASAIAGTRQRENFIVLMDNYKDAIKYTEEAMSSSGTAMEKYDAYLQSVEASQAKLKATFEDFSQLLVDKGIIRGFYDLATAGVEVLSMITRLIPVLQILAVLLIGKLSGKFFANLTMNIYKLNLKLGQSKTTFSKTITNIKAYITSLKSTGTQLMTTGQAAQVAAGKLALMQVVMTAVTAVITIAISAYRKHQQQLEENIEKAKEHIQTVKEEQETLEDLKQQYIDLSKSENYNDETRNSIKSIQEKINELVGDEADGLDLVNGKLDDQIKKLDEISVKNAQDNLKALKGELDTIQKSAGKGVYSLWDYSGFTSKNPIKTTGLLSQLRNQGIDMTEAGLLLGTGIDNISIEQLEKAIEQFTLIRDKINSKEDNEYWNEVNNIVKELTTRLKDYNKALNDYNQTQAQAVVGQYLFNHTISSKEDLKAYIDTLKKGEYSEEALAAMTEILIAKFPKFAKELGLVSKEEDKTSDTTNALSHDLKTLKDTYETLNSAINEYNSNGSISYDTWEKLLEVEDQYLAALVDENGQIKSNTKALQDLMARKIEDATLTRMETYVNNLLTAAKNGTLNQTLLLSEGIETNTNVRLRNIMATIASNAALMQNREQILKTLSAMAQLTSSISLGSDSTKDAKDATEDWEKVLDYANKVLDDHIEKLEKEREAIEKSIEEQIKAKKKEIELLEAEKEALEDKNEEKNKEIELEELQRNLQKAKQRTMRVYRAELNTWVWEQDPEAVQEAQKELDDFYTEQEIDNIDKRIEALEKEVEAIEKTTNNEEESYDKRLKLLDEQIKKAEEYKKKWNSVKTNYEHAQNEITSKARLGADAEKGILEGRITTLNIFKDGYTKALSAVAEQTENSAKRINTALGSFNFEEMKKMLNEMNLAGKTEKDFTYDARNRGTVIEMGASGEKFMKIGTNQWVKMSDVKHLGGSGYQLKSGTQMYITPYASGTKSATSGLANVDEKGNELILPKQGRYRMMEYGDTVVPHNLSQRLFDVASNPLRFIANALNSVKSPNLLSSSNVNSSNSTINIGTVELPSVTNGESFIKQLQLIATNR